jgi:hypothetical protein
LLPTTEFHVRRASPDGLAYKCKCCVRAACAQWRDRNPGAFSRWHAANRDHRSEYFREWSAENREARSAYMRNWAQMNAPSVNARIANRRAAKIRATPAWANQQKIAEIYAEARRLTKATGIRHEVDHIYPLQSDKVCGLHWEANLQIITEFENIQKLNRMPDEHQAMKGRRAHAA